MNTLCAFLLFSLLWIIPALASLPLAFCLIDSFCSSRNYSIRKTQRLFLGHALSIPLGTIFFLLYFSLFGRMIPNYMITTLVSIAAIAVSAGAAALKLQTKEHFATQQDFMVRQHSLTEHNSLAQQNFPNFPNFPLFSKRILDFAVRITPLLIVIAITCLFWIPRWLFSDIHYDPGHYGGEKLFNLSLQQSFSYGHSYPPESLWLAGESEAYYILPRILPGLATSFSIHFFGMSSQIAGIFFHLSDAFYNSLAIATLGAVAYLLLASRNSRGILNTTIACTIATFPFLAIPARALIQTVHGQIELWSLSRIIPFTINEYPFWNYVWADNHAHNNAAFLDVFVTFLFLFIVSFGEKLSKKQKIATAFVTGASAAALYMSQSGSAFIVVIVFTIPAILIATYHCEKKTFSNFLTTPVLTVCFAAIFSMPDLVTRSQPKVLWHWVPKNLATNLADFFNVYLSLNLLFIAFITFTIQQKTSQKSFHWKRIISKSNAMILLILPILFALMLTLGYPVVGVAAVFLGTGFMATSFFNKKDRYFSFSILSGFALMLAFPEVIAANFNMGPEYIRFNTTFKFLYTSFFTLPLALTFIFTIPKSIIPKNVTRFTKNSNSFGSINNNSATTAATAAIIIIIGTFATVQMATLRNRIAAANHASDPTGLAFFQKQHPTDAAIVLFLNTLPGQVVLIEECGMPPKATAYTFAGRISGYSGRTSVCGWGMHSFLHHEIFRNSPRTGQHVWPYLVDIEANAQNLYAVGPMSNQEKIIQARFASQKLRDENVTHIVFGEYEKAQHPLATLEAIATAAQGTIVYKNNFSGVIQISKTPNSE